MSNVLNDEKQQQVRALGRLGWTLSRIQEATGIRRETISGYLKAAGIAVHGRGRRSASKPKPAISEEVSTDLGPPKPATTSVVSTDSGAPPRPGRAPSASACEPYREIIAEALARGRNAVAIWQDLVDDHGFAARYASVRRFLVHLRGPRPPRRGSSSPRGSGRKAKSTMATDPWSATRRRGSTAARGSSS